MRFDFEKEKINNKRTTCKSFCLLTIIFFSSVLFLYYIFSQFPNLDDEEKKKLVLPKNLEDAKNIAFFFVYIFLQTFAIPGSIFLTILSGFLYPFPLALIIVCMCSAIGASFCYILSSVITGRLVLKYFSSRIKQWQKKTKKLKKDMFWYIVFLRITPFVPNWFMNLASPIIQIPLLPFMFGTFIGVAPPSLVYIQAGTTLNELTNSTSIFSLKSIFMLLLVSILSLIPIILPKIFPKFLNRYNLKEK